MAHGWKILIAEDDEDLAQAYRRLLPARMADCDVDVVPDGSNALVLYGEKEHDLVVTDINMPGLNGRDLFRETRQMCRERDHRMPLFLFTSGVQSALDGVDDLCDGIQADTLLKPYTFRTLQQTIESMLADDEDGAT